TALPGPHAVEIALASACVALALGMTPADIAPAVEALAIDIRLRRRAGRAGSVLIDDSYNASTPSVLSALELLEGSGRGRGVARVAATRHSEPRAEGPRGGVGRPPARAAALLVTYGARGELIAQEAPGCSAGSPARSSARRERQALLTFLLAELRPGDV